jgi:hypothetical protein
VSQHSRDEVDGRVWANFRQAAGAASQNAIDIAGREIHLINVTAIRFEDRRPYSPDQIKLGIFRKGALHLHFGSASARHPSRLGQQQCNSSGLRTVQQSHE